MSEALEIVSLNISEKKGVIKKPVRKIELVSTGIKGDAHAGHWHRQVSLLAEESILAAAEKAGTEFPPGVFAENLTTHGFPVHKCAVLDRFASEEIEIEVTQIGKRCHTLCEVGKRVGTCIMPIEGVFARVIRPGTLRVGDRLEYKPWLFRTRIITLSDRAALGIYPDRSGPEIKQILTRHFEQTGRKFSMDLMIIPDQPDQLERQIIEATKQGVQMIITTGSTGIGPRDIAPDVINRLVDKEIPGIMDHIRLKFGQTNPNALISRSTAGIRDKTMIFALPGSVRAVREYLGEMTPLLEHLLRMIHSIDNH